jgi:hypothetical protein
MKEIKAPSNDDLIALCTLVKDPEDVSTIHSIQGKFVLSPLSILGVRELHPTTNSILSSVVGGSGTNALKEIPVRFYLVDNLINRYSIGDRYSWTKVQ